MRLHWWHLQILLIYFCVEPLLYLPSVTIKTHLILMDAWMAIYTCCNNSNSIIFPRFSYKHILFVLSIRGWMPYKMFHNFWNRYNFIFSNNVFTLSTSFLLLSEVLYSIPLNIVADFAVCRIFFPEIVIKYSENTTVSFLICLSLQSRHILSHCRYVSLTTDRHGQNQPLQ